MYLTGKRFSPNLCLNENVSFTLSFFKPLEKVNVRSNKSVLSELINRTSFCTVINVAVSQKWCLLEGEAKLKEAY